MVPNSFIIKIFDGDELDKRLLLYLASRTNNTDRVQHVYGAQVKKSQCFLGTRSLSKALGFNSQKIYRRLLRYENEGLIERKPLHNGTLITLVELALCNSKASKSVTPFDTLAVTQIENIQEQKEKINNKEIPWPKI